MAITANKAIVLNFISLFLHKVKLHLTLVLYKNTAQSNCAGQSGILAYRVLIHKVIQDILR
jgi:hypothetical protein